MAETVTKIYNSVITLGPFAQQYLPRANNSKFGIRYDSIYKSFVVGNKEIKFDYKDIRKGKFVLMEKI